MTESANRNRKSFRVRQFLATFARRDSVRFSAGRLIPAFLGIASTPIVSRVLGPESYGYLASVMAICGVATAVLLGWCEPMAVREFSVPDHRAGAMRLRRCFGIVGAVAVLGAVIAISVSILLRSPMIAIAGAVSLVVGATGLIVGIARGVGDARTFVVTASLGIGGRALGGLAGVLVGFGVTGYFVGWLTVSTAAFIVGFLMLRLPVRFLRPRLPSMHEFRYAMPISGVAVSFLLLQVADRITLLPIVGAELVGIYTLGYSLTELGVSLAASVLHARRFPLLIAQWEGNRDEGLHDLRKNISIAVTIPLALAPILLVYGNTGLVLLGGDRFAASSTWFLVLISIGLAWCGAAQWLSVDLQESRSTARWLYAIVLGVLANVVLVYVFAPLIGINAGGVATLGSYAIMCVAVVMLSGERRMWSTLCEGALPATAACVSGISATYLVSESDPFIRVLCGVISFAVVHFLMSLGALRRREKLKLSNAKIDTCESNRNA